VNAALHDPLTPEVPVTYESGGPTDNVISIWKAAAPAIDIEAPDIYLPHTDQYLKTLELYARKDNPLFVPETTGSPRSARFFFSALGFGAVGYSPFGLDYTRVRPVTPGEPDGKNAFLQPTAQNYELLEPMMREVARLNFEGKLQAAAEPDDHSSQIFHFGDWDAVVSYQMRRRPSEAEDPKREPLGRALVAQLGANEFLVTGMDCVVDFRPAGTVFGTGQIPSTKVGGVWQHRQFLKVEDGHYVNGVFQFDRILNGDQTDFGLRFTTAPQVLRVSLATY
jgi:beta-galactosidase GanA